MKLRARALGLTLGVIWGIAVFIATIWDVAVGMGRTMGLLGVFYPYYSVSYGGAFLGLFWGFVNGFVFGAAVAWLYNKISNSIYKTDTSGM